MNEPDRTAPVWYLRRKNREAGPFTSARLRRLVLEGQVRLEDEVSIDRGTWRQVGTVAEVVPPELRGAASVPARGNRPFPVVAVSLSALLVTGVIGFAFWWGGNRPDADTDCQSPPSAGVDWRNCRMEGARLSRARLPGALLQNAMLSQADFTEADLTGAVLDYASLADANLGYALLRQASARGADLRRADLTNADLTEANLSYADLTGAHLGGARLQQARLEGALWIDGAVCAPGSVGRCVPE